MCVFLDRILQRIAFSGVGLWLVPSEAQSRLLQQILDFIPAKSQPRSPSSYPHFAPHITLVSGIPPSIDITTIVDCIPEGQTSFPVVFESIEIGNVYFRSVYVDIHTSPELSALHQHIQSAVKKLEGAEPRSPSFPHMSIYYIDDSDKHERQIAADALFSSGRAIQNQDNITLMCSGAGTHPAVPLTGFDAEAIWIVKSEGPVEKWEMLKKITLKY